MGSAGRLLNTYVINMMDRYRITGIEIAKEISVYAPSSVKSFERTVQKHIKTIKEHRDTPADWEEKIVWGLNCILIKRGEIDELLEYDELISQQSRNRVQDFIRWGSSWLSGFRQAQLAWDIKRYLIEQAHNGGSPSFDEIERHFKGAIEEGPLSALELRSQEDAKRKEREDDLAWLKHRYKIE